MSSSLLDFFACNNNNKQICIAPQGRNFRGAGARQLVIEQRKKRKPGKRGMPLAHTHNRLTAFGPGQPG